MSVSFHGRSRESGAILSIAAAAAILAGGSGAVAAERFPEVRPADRVQAITALTGATPMTTGCLTPRLESLRADLALASRASRRALAVLEGATSLTGERRFTGPDGTVVRYTLDAGSFDHVAAPGRPEGGAVPDAVQAALRGVEEASALTSQRLGLPSPGPVEVLLADVSDRVDGYLLPRAGLRARPLLVVRAAPAEAVREAAFHQYVHAAAAALPPAWGEALAHWAGAALGGGPGGDLLELLSLRIERLSAGLLADDPDLAAGNALWLAFLEQAHGPSALRLAVEELASGDPGVVAFGRALQRAGTRSLESALRDFHLWCVLTGERSDGRHFTFADRLPSASFASRADGTPELSVQADPPLAPLGLANVLIRPRETEGGISVAFEGEVPGRWEADLLLAHRDGTLHRVPLAITDGRAEVTVPQDRLAEAVLMIRNLAGDENRPMRYTWSVHRVRGFPFEMGALEASFEEAAGGVTVSWETLSESPLLGFNLLRTDEESGETVTVNPVWIPAVGDLGTPVSYRYLDTTARAGQAYLYGIEAITAEGLSSRSEPVPVSAPNPR